MGKRRDVWKRVVEQIAQQRPLSGSQSSARDAVNPADPEVLPPRRGKGFVDAVREASEQSAKRVLTDAFDDKRDDLEEMAVRALRRSIEQEGDRLERLIEKSIEIKRREARLSLMVLLVATVVYVALALAFD